MPSGEWRPEGCTFIEKRHSHFDPEPCPYDPILGVTPEAFARRKAKAERARIEWTYMGTVDETRMGDNILGHGGTVYAATTAEHHPQFAKGGVIEGPNGEDSVPAFLDRSYAVPARAWRPGHRPVCSCGDSWPCPQTKEAEIRKALIDACHMIIKRLAND